jgi:cobaltochelatase CobS
MTIFQHGILPVAMRRGVWLIINEIDTIDPHTMNILKPVLEDPPRLTILENGGEVVRAHPDFRIFATANTWARGDSTGLFTNTHVQSDADQRRWSARVLLDYMTDEEELGLLKGYFDDMDEPTLSKFIVVANKVRDAFKVGKIDKTFSPAELVCWVENFIVCGKSEHHAARLSFLNSLEPDVHTAISEMIVAVFGQEKGRP